MQGVFAGDFEILSPLAEGGMGAVYLARQISTGKRRALKIMQPELVADARARERFALEATIGSRIESEHVVEVLAAGIDERTGTPWLAMELLEGQNLAAYVAQRQRLPQAEVWEIFRQLGHALAAAHRQGIVHRDIKPENVFITRSRSVDAALLVKVLDFGIAKLTQEQLGQSRRTQAVGSPLWMAPEQTDATLTPTPAADVWALGLMAFHALTGRPYWRAANDPDPRIAVLFAEILTQPIVAASARAAELGAPGTLPPAFDGWFGLCVARDPAQRFRDATPAIAALEPVLSAGYAARRDQMVAPTLAAQSPVEPPRAKPMAATPPLATPPLAIPATAMMQPSSVPIVTPYAPTRTPPAHAAFPSATPYAPVSPPSAPHAAPRRSWALIGLFVFGVLFALGGISIAVVAVVIGPRRVTTTTAPPPPITTVAPVAVAEVDAATPPPPTTTVAVVAPATTVTSDTLPTGADPTASDEPAPDDHDAAPEFTWADGASATLRGRCHYTTHDYTFTFNLRRSGASVTGSGDVVVRRVSPGLAGLSVGDTAHFTFMGSRTPTTLQLIDNQGCQYDFRVRRDGGVSGTTSTSGRLSGRFAH